MRHSNSKPSFAQPKNDAVETADLCDNFNITSGKTGATTAITPALTRQMIYSTYKNNAPAREVRADRP
jgi:hypothetical protein